MNIRVIFFFIFIFFTYGIFAQMTDNQVIEFVKSEHSKGTDEREIGTELLKRGVSQEQIERIKSQNERISTTSSKTVEKADSPKEVLRSESSLSSEGSSGGGSSSAIYGHNIFSSRDLSYSPRMNIPTPINYKLGPGDEVVIEIWGVSETVYRKVIAPEGSINIGGIGPIYLSGLTIDEAEKYARKKMSAIYTTLSDKNESSNFRLSLGQTRTIQVNVMGEVKTPGTYNLSSLSSLFHALYKADGVNGIGSLRSINLYRNGKKEYTVDIYEFLVNGKFNNDIRLEDGDVIIVPAYEALVNISGQIKRPMIYEMKSSETVFDIINYAGGWAKGANLDNISLNRNTKHFKQIYSINPDALSTFTLIDGDSIFVGKGVDRYENRVEVVGNVYHPGYYELSDEIKRIKDLIYAAGGFKEDVFYDRAILFREKEDLTFESLSLNLNYLDSSENNIELQPNDRLYIKSRIVEDNLGPFVITGMVEKPGEYPYVDNMTVKDLVFLAGGLLSSASTVNIEISRRIIEPERKSEVDTIAHIFSFEFIGGIELNGEAEFVLMPFDHIYVRKSPGYQEQKNIILDGEVVFSGNYTLENKGDRVSDIIERAGGLTKYAYPKGTRLIRRATEIDINRQKEYRKLMRKEDLTIDINIETEYSVGIDLEKALKYPQSSYDVLLKDGDKIIIPEFANTVKVNGAVMQPNTMVYEEGKSVRYFIKEAGGYSKKAEKRRTYIVYMSGKGKRAYKYSAKIIEPGCEIVIPFKEEKEREKMTLAQTVALSSTVASMASVVALLINAMSKK